MRYSCYDAGARGYELRDGDAVIGVIYSGEVAEEVTRRLNTTNEPALMKENALELYQQLHEITDNLVERIAGQCEDIGDEYGAGVITFNTPIPLYQDHEDRYEAPYEVLVSIDREARMEIRTADGDVAHLDISEWVECLEQASRHATWALEQINDALLNSSEWTATPAA